MLPVKATVGADPLTVPETGAAVVATGVPITVAVVAKLELELVDAAEKLVGTLTGVTPAGLVTDNTPVAVPVAAPAGMFCPGVGTKFPPWIVPVRPVVAPAGVNVAVEPFGTVPPVKLI